MSDDEQMDTTGKSEAQLRMEAERQRRKERAEEEWREYEETRKVEREKEDEEIRQLRERREQRKKEREEEEKRLAELRAVEEQKRRAEEEERQRKKREEEQRKREEREKKRAEFEARSKNVNTPNFVINKKAGGPEKEEEEEKKVEVTKSKEQLEAEKKAVLEQRVPPLNINGFKADQLKSKAKELHDMIYRIEGDKYDLEQRFARQSYEMQELAERARQMNKGSGKTTKTVQNTPDPLAAKISGIPPKVIMYSEYERVKDHRSFGDRKGVFNGPLYSDEYKRIEPTQRVTMTESGFRVGEDGEVIQNGHHHEEEADIAVDESESIQIEE